jgi:hypothetical protein
LANRNEKRMMSAACKYAYSRFALNYYMLYEELSETLEYSEKQKGFHKAFFELVKQFLGGEYPVEKLDLLRRQIISETEIISYYVDYFETFESVLNRMELRFLTDPVTVIPDNGMVNRIMQYIVSAKDSPEQNERIRQILEQLPIRYTKGKFFSIVSHALSVYEGTGRQSLEQLLDLIRAEALLKEPADIKEGHEKLYHILETLKNGNYKDPKLEEFKTMQDSLVLTEEILSKETSDCMMMMDLVNDFYVICLTRRDTLMDHQEEVLFHTLFQKGMEGLEHQDFAGEDELESLLVRMEGMQEYYYEQWAKYELTDLESKIKDSNRTEEDLAIWKVDRLLSTSSFMSLDPEDELCEDDGLLSRKAVEELCSKLFDELEASWNAMPKRVVRAVMSRILANIPMFFQTSDEIREFIQNSFSSCADLSEKAACFSLIDTIMESDHVLV